MEKCRLQNHGGRIQPVGQNCSNICYDSHYCECVFPSARDCRPLQATFWCFNNSVYLDVILFVLSTVNAVENAAGRVLDWVELVSVCIFTLEYFLRIWCCVEKLTFAVSGPILGRLRYLLTVSSIVDLISFVPYWAQFIIEWFRSGDPFNTESVSFIAAIRILRIFQLFKANKYVHAIEILKVVFKRNRDILLTTGTRLRLKGQEGSLRRSLALLRCHGPYAVPHYIYCALLFARKRYARLLPLDSRRNVHGGIASQRTGLHWDGPDDTSWHMGGLYFLFVQYCYLCGANIHFRLRFRGSQFHFFVAPNLP